MSKRKHTKIGDDVTKDVEKMEAELSSLSERLEELKKQAVGLSDASKKAMEQEAQAVSVKQKKRSAEILGVFAAHNFYVNGFTPLEMRTTLEEKASHCRNDAGGLRSS